MTEPWNFTEAQRRQFREAHAAAKEAEMARAAEIPDFTTWTLDRLTAHKRHLEGILNVSAGQGDPDRPQLRAEHEAVCAAIARARAEIAEEAAIAAEMAADRREYFDLDGED